MFGIFNKRNELIESNHRMAMELCGEKKVCYRCRHFENHQDSVSVLTGTQYNCGKHEFVFKDLSECIESTCNDWLKINRKPNHFKEVE